MILIEKTRLNFLEMHRLLAELRDSAPERGPRGTAVPARAGMSAPETSPVAVPAALKDAIGKWMDDAFCLAVAVASGAKLDINPDLQDERYFNAWLAWHAMDMCKLMGETPPQIQSRLAKLKSLPMPEHPIALYAPKYYFTFDVFTNRIPGFSPLLAVYAGRADVRFLEIGSFEGMSACWFLDNVLTHPTSNLTCIDVQYSQRFDENINCTGQEDRVIKLAGKSEHVLPSLPTHYYDFIYVDGDHDTQIVFDDCRLSWPLLKRDGIILFDDYLYQPDFMAADPRAGVDAFLATVAGQYRVVHSGYQLAVQKC
jgi:hypothetical protein